MSEMAKYLLLAEILLCFGPLTLFLLIAPLLLPVQFYVLATEPLHWEGPFLVMGSIVGGIAGITALLLVVSKLLTQKRIDRPLPVLAAVTLGVTAVVGMGVGEGTPALIFQGLPLAATAHILYLSRRLFVPLVRAEVKHNVWCWIWLTIPAGLALSASIVAAHVNQSRQELLDGQARWNRVRPLNYSFESNFAGIPLAATVGLPRKIDVQGDSVVSAVYTFVPTPGIRSSDPPPELHAWTMNRIFEELLKAQQSGARVRAQYDEHSGFVMGAEVNFPDLDASWSLTARNFQPRMPK